MLVITCSGLQTTVLATIVLLLGWVGLWNELLLVTGTAGWDDSPAKVNKNDLDLTENGLYKTQKIGGCMEL